jgi:PHD/YefM family antitoxin component YafN of YafNO toxin-antitoxin module
MGMQMASTVLQTLALQAQLHAATFAADTLGAAMNAAAGPIGWIVMGVQLLTQAITAIANVEDKKIENEIERQTQALDEANEAYERFESAMEDAYSTEQIRVFTKEMEREMDKAIEAQEAIVAARKSAKNANVVGHEDYEALKEAENALDELYEKQEERLKDTFSTLTDGILDSVNDAAKEFTDAWYEAFKETGDGLSGLEENFEEMFMTLAKKQAAQQITGAYVKMWQDSLKKVINPEEGDTELTPEEAAEWAEKIKATFPELSAALEGFLGVISEGVGERGGLSDLQKGIQGVTEQTAQVLEALLNSMRDTQANAYSELQTQTNILKDIKGILSDLTSPSPRAISVKLT